MSYHIINPFAWVSDNTAKRSGLVDAIKRHLDEKKARQELAEILGKKPDESEAREALANILTQHKKR